MSFKKRLYIYVILSFISMGIVNAHSITIQQTIDWPEFMSSQDMIWEVLPEYWHESAYLGNGRLGLMIYKELEKTAYGSKPVTAMYPRPQRKETYSGRPDYSPVTLHYTPKGKSSVVRCASTFGTQKLQQILSLPKERSI